MLLIFDENEKATKKISKKNKIPIARTNLIF